jgi:glucose/mannose-6-phosphate isomerase
MVDLDDHSAYRRFDKSGMLDHLHRFPQECHRAWEQVLTFEVPREYRRISNVIILGMGFLVDYRAPPRAAFPHNFIPLVGILQKLGLIRDKSAEIMEALNVLDRMASELSETQPLVSNAAKKLAARLQGRVVVIYGAELFSEVARRWKAQLNENSKNWAFCETLPELNHNAVIGYEFPPEARDRVFVIMLGSGLLGSRNSLRYRATSELLQRAGIDHEFVEGRGDGTLSQIMSMVLLGDYCSFYLAMLNEVDPTTIDAIDFVKQYLAGHTVSTD